MIDNLPQGKYSDDNHISIVFGGYLDSNNRLMDRAELNRRIHAIQEELKSLNEEGFKMSAELEYYRRFHDYVKSNSLIGDKTYKQVCEFLFSEDDR